MPSPNAPVHHRAAHEWRQIAMTLVEVKDNESLKIGNQIFVSNSQQTRNANWLSLCVWERPPGSEIPILENKHRMTHMGHFHAVQFSARCLYEEPLPRGL